MSIGYQLKQTQHALRIKMDEALKALLLTTPQYAVLAQLHNKPGLSNAALARAAFVTAQTMHAIVANLEKRKLLQRIGDPEHGRKLCAELTKEGENLFHKADKLVEQTENRMLRKTNKKEIDLLTNVLLRCRQNLFD